MGKRISPESIIDQNLSLGLDQFLRKINKHDLLVCGTGNMEGGPPKKNRNIKVWNKILYSFIHLLYCWRSTIGSKYDRMVGISQKEPQ